MRPEESTGKTSEGVALKVICDPRFERPMEPLVREVRLLTERPWVRSVGRLAPVVTTQGWRFPSPPMGVGPAVGRATAGSATGGDDPFAADSIRPVADRRMQLVRVRPSAETVSLRDRLLYLLQPPLDGVFQGRQLEVPFEPYPYQLEGIAFLLPRHHALLADEMGLGKTAQTILALRLLFHHGEIRNGLIVCPKPLLHNWARELRLWAPEVPFEVIDGEPDKRRTAWTVSNCTLKLVNYETLTRDVDLVASDPTIAFDVVVLDEAQRIKNRDSKTSQAARAVRRQRSWALTGTPIENHPDELVNIFAFIDPGRIPPDTPPKRLPQYTSDCILRRTKEVVQADMPPRIFRDLEIDLTPAQRSSYDRAEKDGIVHLNELGETLTVQHVFQLVLRLKQICNFDPLTGESAKLDQLLTDMEEVAESGHKAIVFSQWIEPLQILARALAPFGPLQYHGRIPPADRNAILERFKNDPDCRVLLMSYGTGSVGLNLQFTNYVFLFDRWWNPAVEDQAINRAHRIGQKHPVVVTRFQARGTIEQRIADILDAKRKVFSDLLAQADKPPTLGLTEEEIFGLFDIRSPRSH